MPRAKATPRHAKLAATSNAPGSLPPPAVAGFQTWPHVPRLVVFDLDFTLWYPEMYQLSGAPFRKHHTTGAVTDCNGEEVHLFHVVPTVLRMLRTDPQFQATTKVAVASRTTEPHWAKTCMRLLDVAIGDGSKDWTHDDQDKDPDVVKTSLESLVDYVAIYPRPKRVHFEQLKHDSGVPYEEMLFFDNEYDNVRAVQKLGVVCTYCPQGLTEGAWMQGMEAFQAARRT